MLKVSFFLANKKFGNEKSNGGIFNKSYSLRFIDSARFMNASLDSLAISLSGNFYNRKCRYCMKCKEYKKYEKVYR